jgi:glycosyltransferase involved in cell wall biosynthesis
MKVSVVMPAYNECQYIEEVVEKVLGTNIPQELIIVDDNSTDGTKDLITKLAGRRSSGCQIKVFLHERNLGKGAALQTGFKHVTGDVVIIQDADLEYDPNDYPILLSTIRDGRADVVFGSRFLGGPHRVLYFWHSLANKFITLLSNMLNDINLSDMETGYKAFRASILKEITFTSERFGFEPEFTAKVAKKRYRLYEVPVSYSGRTYGQGKKINWKDGLAALWWIMKYRLMD